MSEFEAAFNAFTLFSAMRLLAYLPQINAIISDKNGAAGVSCFSWGLLSVSHMASAAYALMSVGDWALAGFALANGLACAAVVLLTQAKRIAYRKNGLPAGIALFNLIRTLVQQRPTLPLDRRPLRYLRLQ